MPGATGHVGDTSALDGHRKPVECPPGKVVVERFRVATLGKKRRSTLSVLAEGARFVTFAGGVTGAPT